MTRLTNKGWYSHESQLQALWRLYLYGRFYNAELGDIRGYLDDRLYDISGTEYLK